MHERQAVVFGLLIAFLALVGLGALAVYTGAIEAPFDRALSTPEEADELADVDVPCLPEETLPVAAKKVHVTVLNASGSSAPLAGTNQESLLERGFTVDAIGNAPDADGVDGPDPMARTQIHFGAKGIAAAYTLAAHYQDPGLVLDDREGGAVDLYIGEDFVGLVDPELVGLDADTPLEDPAGCVPLDEVAPTPSPAPPAEDDPAAEAAQG
ncbi:LytR C-terminal domain-containing protein [Cellulosimicrobium arenosum]|uniref:LytR C-terminal domain-containing protein n=2 Tax=Cellulosimicrobium arenosum TaxID=2708133 RepID=A0A927J0Q0_9MICO|nr:LytR C-terminal domain-containing protein [Cellulosimicrobium arenosum]MBD8079708.1 LytR C-terminal domain-containing protein [Cellulosimicrobium arenosum]